MKLSVVIPAYNEEETVAETVEGVVAALAGEGIEHEVIVVDDSSTDGTAARGRRLASGHPQVRCLPSPFRNGFGFAVRAGLDAFEGDAVAIVMADGSDSPEDLVAYQRLLEEGYECAFGSRFIRGSRVDRLPALEADHEPDRQLRHPRALPPRLQRHDERLQGLPARGDREPPAASSPTTSTSRSSCR